MMMMMYGMYVCRGGTVGGSSGGQEQVE